MTDVADVTTTDPKRPWLRRLTLVFTVALVFSSLGAGQVKLSARYVLGMLCLAGSLCLLLRGIQLPSGWSFAFGFSLWLLGIGGLLRMYAWCIHQGFLLQSSFSHDEDAREARDNGYAGSPLPRLRSATPVRRARVVEWLLWRHASNLFFRISSQGRVRMVLAHQGLSLLGVLTITGVLMSVGTHLPGCPTGLVHSLGWVLVYVLLLMALMGAWAGFLLALRCVATERDQGTWPLLMMSGLRPECFVDGIFSTCSWVLSGPWTTALPFWILASIVHPPLLLLVAVEPAAIALGALAGLASLGLASESDPSKSCLDAADFLNVRGLGVAGLFLLVVLAASSLPETLFALVVPTPDLLRWNSVAFAVCAYVVLCRFLSWCARRAALRLMVPAGGRGAARKPWI